MTTDPLRGKYAVLTPYHFASNSPILFKDIDGNDFYAYGEGNQEAVLEVMTNTFGENHGFSFDENDMLIHVGEYAEKAGFL